MAWIMKNNKKHEIEMNKVKNKEKNGSYKSNVKIFPQMII